MEFKQQVEEALVEVKKLLEQDGGDCEIVEAADGIVKVRLQGSCKGCPFAAMTLKMRIEKIIKDRVPEVKEVVAVD